MASPLNLSSNTRSGVNLVLLVAAVAVLWWRMDRLERQVDALTTAVIGLQVRPGATDPTPPKRHSP